MTHLKLGMENDLYSYLYELLGRSRHYKKFWLSRRFELQRPTQNAAIDMLLQRFVWTPIIVSFADLCGVNARLSWSLLSVC
jgi:hypothetical protein